jgi:F-type H+-transporting ATPase subunit a
MVDPMSQFVVKTVLPLKVGDLDLSITNSTLAMAGAATLLCLFFGLAFSRAAIVPSRMQTIGELLYELIDDLGESILGHAGKAFFPLVFSLFAFIMTMNFMGMFLVFTPTSQLAVTATLAMITMGIVVIVGFVKNGLGFFKLFVPSGVPIFLLPLMVPIEIISFLVRPLTLALRLFGNMLGGHVVLNIFGSFVVSLGLLGLAGGIATLGFFGSALALSSVVALLALEFIVAFLQAFVFAALTCVYLNDVVNLHHH